MVSATSPVSAGDTLHYPPTSEPDDDSDKGFYAVWRGRPHYMSVPIQGKTHLVHRLVAMTWLTNTWFAGAEVNHRTRIRDDHQLQAELAYDEIDSSRHFPVTFDEMTEKSVTLTDALRWSFQT